MLLKISAMDHQTMTVEVNKVKAALLDVAAQMTMLQRQGIKIEFAVILNSNGEYQLNFKALREMKLDN